MIIYENECCDCATDGYPCKGDSCKRLRVPHYYCDGACGEEHSPDDLYDADGDMLCAACLLGLFKTVAETQEVKE